MNSVYLYQRLLECKFEAEIVYGCMDAACDLISKRLEETGGQSITDVEKMGSVLSVLELARDKQFGAMIDLADLAADLDAEAGISGKLASRQPTFGDDS